MFRRLLRVLDYAYLFFALVILSSLLWAGAGLVLVWAPISFLLSWFFPYFWARWGALAAVYFAVLSGSVGFFWGLGRWRKHLEDEALKAARRNAKK